MCRGCGETAVLIHVNILVPRDVKFNFRIRLLRLCLSRFRDFFFFYFFLSDDGDDDDEKWPRLSVHSDDSFDIFPPFITPVNILRYLFFILSF